MKILIFGAAGQLGCELSLRLARQWETVSLARESVDLRFPASITRAIETHQPDVLVNAAAYTAVDRAETERDLAFAINTEATRIMAQASAIHGITMIHYSTDYVFDGEKKAPYLETDTANPINVYGRTKLGGEEEIRGSGSRHLIFRVSGVIGQHGSNFAKTILRLAQERSELKVIEDQRGVPTTTPLIARVTTDAISAIEQNQPWDSGIYHLAPKGQTNWFEIAYQLLVHANARGLTLTAGARDIQPITTAQFPTAAKRPQNSLLNTSKLQRVLDFQLPSWKDEFLAVADQIIMGQQSA